MDSIDPRQVLENRSCQHSQPSENEFATSILGLNPTRILVANYPVWPEAFDLS
jgi:hypothetical protein